MSDIRLFRVDKVGAVELAGQSSALEKSLQTLMERNLEPLLGIRFLASEHSTGSKHKGRIDTLGVDENGCPVIIEYKRATNENVINQGLFYLDWLMDHQAEFELAVLKLYGKDAADGIDWSAPRLLCIAGDFTRYDEHAVQQMNRNIELIRYRQYPEDLLLLELVNATSAQSSGGASGTGGTANAYKTISQMLGELDGELLDLYEALKAYLLALGDDVQEKVLKYYIAFKRIKNFACVEVRPQKGAVVMYVKVDPASIDLESGFTRDVASTGHYGTGDLEITLRSTSDLERAKALVLQSYEAS